MNRRMATQLHTSYELRKQKAQQVVFMGAMAFSFIVGCMAGATLAMGVMQ